MLTNAFAITDRCTPTSRSIRVAADDKLPKAAKPVTEPSRLSRPAEVEAAFNSVGHVVTLHDS